MTPVIEVADERPEAVEAMSAPERGADETDELAAVRAQAEEYLAHLQRLQAEFDMVLVMTVEPGFGGQPFLDAVVPKIRTARELIDRSGSELWLQVDGGVTEETIERCAEAGADVFVCGSAVYDAANPGRAVEALRSKAEKAVRS